jgi:hypothetical protein
MVSREEDLVLSNLAPSRAQQRLALIVALLIVLPALLISATVTIPKCHSGAFTTLRDHVVSPIPNRYLARSERMALQRAST